MTTDASEGRPESTEDRASGGRGEGSAAESISVEDGRQSSCEWTADRVNEA